MSFFSLISKSGFIGYTLILLSVVSLAIVIEKIVMFRSSKIVPKDRLKTMVMLLSTNKIGDVIEFCKRNRFLLSEIIIEAFRNIGEISRVNFLNAFEVIARKKVAELERGMTLLATIATIAPLLGLLGTVLGMVKIFGVLDAGTSGIANPQQLSAGIAEALLTTVFGLIVAVPSYVAYNLLQRKLDKLVLEIEQAGVIIANNLKGFK
ncbi:MotA/TolQ/ExbB proton channel family protein [Desulfurobacterium atlanticum]|uniref:Biopolymer transport protein ExbB n=1 Tax=Desulfurobacterium atlanticum TaxID=240169 RepID=A0A238ZWC5_9BACT|nr:MotA/TolQ/ExbB proton channel family protein [Desulfurobacterium atlanticum]SNR87291.1 biopolymer transport protein ExbB [Desulfurobacterium atlanticum]